MPSERRSDHKGYSAKVSEAVSSPKMTTPSHHTSQPASAASEASQPVSGPSPTEVTGGGYGDPLSDPPVVVAGSLTGAKTHAGPTCEENAQVGLTPHKTRVGAFK